MAQAGTPGNALPSVPLPDEAQFLIAAHSGAILHCNDAAASLLGVSAAALGGTPWMQALHCEPDAATVLAYALQARRHVSLPPFILRNAQGEEIAVGGLLLPQLHEGRAACRALLWPLLSGSQLQLPGAPTPSDTLAVLGVDQLRYDAHWGERETAQLLADIRDSLLEIVRNADSVGVPTAASLLITLRDVDLDGARDICRALLSHLRRQHTRPGTATAGLRLRIGLAQRQPGSSALSTLLRANNALLHAQRSGAKDPIRACADDDFKLNAGWTLTSAGIFSDAFEAAEPSVEPVSAPPPSPPRKQPPPVAPIERNIEGYVVDNMEGAVDQAIFLAQLDVPVAIIGPAGTGKMYVAKIIHDESGAAADMLVTLDCREMRNRGVANTRIARELVQGEGKTLVFKSPHLLRAEVQLKLARQISSRTLADVSPPCYLPRVKLVALFPDRLETLIRRGELVEPLASAFAGYPIYVPPIKDRKQAVLRWAHKILGQEGASRDRDMKGFTPDAEQAMLLYDWPGNISEMRRCIHDALEKTDKDWLTPVDLGLFTGIDPDAVSYLPEPKPFLASAQAQPGVEDSYAPTVVESLHVALGEAVHGLLALNAIKPLGAWLEDEIVLAALDRYRGDLRRSGEFLHTKPRNISRWLAKIAEREEDRNSSALWQNPRRLVREWVRESAQGEESPLVLMTQTLMAHVNEQGAALGVAARAQIMGVSTPTYLKRVRESGSGKRGTE